MPPPSKCPSCGAKLEEGAENCPNCPWSWREEEPAQSPLKNDNFRAFVMPAVLFGGMGLAIWKFAMFMVGSIQDNNAQIEHEHRVEAFKKMTPEEAQEAIKRGTPEDMKAVQAALDEANAQRAKELGLPANGTAPAGDGAPGEEKEAEGPGSVSIVSAEPAGGSKPPKVVKEWKMRGHVYDLVSLNPVGAATLTFTDNDTNTQARTTTDSTGRYRIILPPLEGRGYLVTIAKAGYEKTYLNPGTEGVNNMSAAKRKELASELGTTIGEPASVQPFSDEPLITDFHLAPMR